VSTSLYDLSVNSYVQIVEAAVGFMQKGADFCRDKEVDSAALVTCRLYEDMAPFHFQAVCIAHHSLGAIRGLEQGQFAPPSGYGELDYAGLQNLLTTTLEGLRGLQADEVNSMAGRKLVFKLGDNEIPFTAENFILSFSLPNFYFHATTAYDILRSQGVSLGKRDFLGQMRMG
jgi:uncharacterized protein